MKFADLIRKLEGLLRREDKPAPRTIESELKLAVKRGLAPALPLDIAKLGAAERVYQFKAFRDAIQWMLTESAEAHKNHLRPKHKVT